MSGWFSATPKWPPRFQHLQGVNSWEGILLTQSINSWEADVSKTTGVKSWHIAVAVANVQLWSAFHWAQSCSFVFVIGLLWSRRRRLSEAHSRLSPFVEASYREACPLISQKLGLGPLWCRCHVVSSRLFGVTQRSRGTRLPCWALIICIYWRTRLELAVAQGSPFLVNHMNFWRNRLSSNSPWPKYKFSIDM